MIGEHATDYLASLQALGWAKRTVARQEKMLTSFFNWVSKEKLLIGQLNKENLERYTAHVFSTHSKLTYDTQLRYFKTVQGFFDYLQNTGATLTNPAAAIRFQSKSHRVPQDVLTLKEMQKVLSGIETASLQGLRNRALLEILYATGIRRHEAAAIECRDIDFTAQTLVVRDAKNKTDRLIPVHPRALDWVKAYLKERTAKSKHLFLNYKNAPLTADAMHEITTAAFKAAGIEHKTGCHILRHSIATHLLERGCDIRFIQVLLGHKKLSSTQVYTRTNVQKLKEIHRRTHPAGKTTKSLSEPLKTTDSRKRAPLPQWKRTRSRARASRPGTP